MTLTWAPGVEEATGDPRSNTPGGAGNDVGALRHLIISLGVETPHFWWRCRRL